MGFAATDLKKEHLEQAADLVRRSYQALRSQHPLLPKRYEMPGQIEGLLVELGDEPAGVAALDGGRLIGFMASMSIPEFMGKRAAYSPEYGNGAEPAAEGTERRWIYEQMYTRLSAEWVDQGLGLHVVSLMANEEAGREAFHWMGFGMVAVDALREARPIEAASAGITIRQAGMDQKPEVDELLLGLERYMMSAPVFWEHELENLDDLLSGERGSLWLAYDGEQAVGLNGLVRGYNGGCAILQDDETIQLKPAYIKEGWRKRGVGSLLLKRCLEQAQQAGYKRVGVDFESMNISAARFWTKWFEPVCYSLVRWVDERVYTATCQNKF